MRRLAKWLGVIALVLLLGVAVLFAASWSISRQALQRVYTVYDPPLAVAESAATLARGKHLYNTRGCGDCHAADGGGRVLFDAPGVVLVAPSNLTRTARDPTWSDDDLAAAIRHGIRHDGTPLIVMPAGDYADLDDVDIAAIVHYVRSLPPVDRDPGRSHMRAFGRVLYTLGKLPVLPAESVDHAPRARRAPAESVSVAYGKYVAQSCTGCHGNDFSGGRVIAPGKPPSANLTRHANGLAHWTEADFLTAMRSGRRPDGSQLDPMMPWTTYAGMQDVELRAIWLYLATLPPLAGPTGSR